MKTPEERKQADAKRRIAAGKAKAAETEGKPNGHAVEDKGAAEPWRGLLLTTKEGVIRDCLANVAHILRVDPTFAGRVRYDDFLEASVTRDMPWRPGGEWREWTEADDLRLADWCQRRNVPLKPGTCADGVAVVSDEHRFHPVRNYLEALRWDEGERLELWLVTYLGCEDTPFIRAVGKAWLLQAVARIYEPGCKADYVLLLEGSQGIKKSSAFEALCADRTWFTDSIADLGTKDSAQDLRGKWIIEMGELSAMKRGEVERIKSFISRKVDHYRPSYGKRSRDFLRQSVLGGTTNNDEYLIDATGNRRFWPAQCGKLDLVKLANNRDQLWAEAVVAYKRGDLRWLDESGEKLAQEEQEQRRGEDPWERPIRAKLATRKLAISKEVILQDLGITVEKQEEKHGMRVGKIMKLLGWSKRRTRVGAHGWDNLYHPPMSGEA